MPTLPKDVRTIILDYVATWELRDWIASNEIDWVHLAENTHPRAIELMIENPELAYWSDASTNPTAWPWLRDHPELICYDHLASNPNPDAFQCALNNLDKAKPLEEEHLSMYPHAIGWLTNNQDKIDWYLLSSNPAAEALLMANPDKIYWPSLHRNPAPWAIAMIKDNPKRHSVYLADNPEGFDILMKRATRTMHRMYDVMYEEDKNLCINLVFDALLPIVIDWHMLSKNTNPLAVSFALKHPEHISWTQYSRNPAAITKLKYHEDQIDWEAIWENPSIFELKQPQGVSDLLDQLEWKSEEDPYGLSKWKKDRAERLPRVDRDGVANIVVIRELFWEIHVEFMNLFPDSGDDCDPVVGELFDTYRLSLLEDPCDATPIARLAKTYNITRSGNYICRIGRIGEIRIDLTSFIDELEKLYATPCRKRPITRAQYLMYVDMNNKLYRLAPLIGLYHKHICHAPRNEFVYISLDTDRIREISPTEVNKQLKKCSDAKTDESKRI